MGVAMMPAGNQGATAIATSLRVKFSSTACSASLLERRWDVRRRSPFWTDGLWWALGPPCSNCGSKQWQSFWHCMRKPQVYTLRRPNRSSVMAVFRDSNCRLPLRVSSRILP